MSARGGYTDRARAAASAAVRSTASLDPSRATAGRSKAHATVRSTLLATVVAATCLTAATPARAQTSRANPTDFHAWAGATLELDLPNRWEATLQYRLRMVDNASIYRGSYLGGEAAHGPVRWLSILGGYRLALVDDRTYHRLAGGVEAIARMGALRASFRPMLQYQRRNFADNDEQAGDGTTLLRTRLRARYRPTDRLDVYAAVEPYFAFGEDYPIDNWRNTVGIKYGVLPDIAVDLFYIYRPDYTRSYNRTFHVVGVDLEIARRIRW
jgi:hypothetical protein